MDTIEVVRLYEQEGWTLRRIARQFNTNHHKVRRLLVRHGIEITQKGRKREPFTEEHKRNIGNSSRGRTCYWKGKNMPKDALYKNMRAHLKYDVDLEWLHQFDDIEKLKVLNRSFGKKRDCRGLTVGVYQSFIEKFYHDNQFNKIYAKWADSGSCDKYLKPSLDHIVPKSQGGALDDLDNLQFLTWFENRCKNDMSQSEWLEMKHNLAEYLL